MELSDLYSEKILEIAGNIPVRPRLERPHGTARRTSRTCGSVIEVDVEVRDGVITAFGQDVSACALGQTSAAVVAANIVGTPVAEFRRVRAEMFRMLTDKGPPPQALRWADLRFLEPVREYRARHASTMLVFDAVVAALDEVETDPRMR